MPGDKESIRQAATRIVRSAGWMVPNRPDSNERDARLLWAWVIALVVASALYRVVPYYLSLGDQAHYLWNFAPIGALGLFVGSRLRSPAAFLVPVGAMFLSDLLLIKPLHDLGMSAFGLGRPIIYASFALYVLIGRLVTRGESSPMVIGGAALLGGTQFFLVSNFAVWLSGVRYPFTLGGLLECYAAGVPFYRNTLAGDLMFSVLFFALYAVIERSTSNLKVEAAGMKFAAIIEYIQDKEKIQSIRPAHRQYLTSLLQAGRLAVAGPFTDDSGALIVYEAPSAEEAEKILKGDPFCQNGIFVRWQLRPWNTVMANRELFPAT